MQLIDISLFSSKFIINPIITNHSLFHFSTTVFFFTGGNVKKGSQDVKIPLKVLIVASHRTGSSLLGDILSYSRNTSYFFEPMRDAERGFNMSFPHWLPWSTNQIQIGFSTLDKLFSCQYVSKLKQRLFDFLVTGDCATVK